MRMESSGEDDDRFAAEGNREVEIEPAGVALPGDRSTTTGYLVGCGSAGEASAGQGFHEKLAIPG